jgi:drug/metabolite transporter (DMT)-like permease
MIRAAKVVCWVFVVLDLVSIGALYRMNPNRALGGALVTLLPFVFALVALYSEPARWKTWTAIALNAILALIGLVILTFAPQAAEPLVAALAGIVLILVPAFIIAVLVIARKRAAVAEAATS